MDHPRTYSQLSKVAYPLFGSKLTEVRGLDNLPKSGGYIIAANHVDWLDGFYIATAIGRSRGTPVYFLTKSKYYWWTTVIIPIPRQKGDIIDQSVGHLKKGKTIVIFPEGERNPTAKLFPGKTGTVRMAIAAGVPVVPLGITCSYGRNVGQSLVYLMSKGHPVRIAIGKPLTFTPPASAISNTYLHQETERLMNALAPLCHKSV